MKKFHLLNQNNRFKISTRYYKALLLVARRSMLAEHANRTDENTQFNFYQLLPCINDAEPSGRDNKLCSQLKSLRVTFETPHASITPLERRKTPCR